MHIPSPQTGTTHSPAGLQKQRSASSYRPTWLGKDFIFGHALAISLFQPTDT